MRCAARHVAMSPGELLPRLFTLTVARRPRRLFSVTLLCRRRQVAVNNHGALRCPDFPLAALEVGKRLTARLTCFSLMNAKLDNYSEREGALTVEFAARWVWIDFGSDI